MPLIDVSPQRVIMCIFFLEMRVTHLKNITDVRLSDFSKLFYLTSETNAS
jgi:hypothetical protein